MSCGGDSRHSDFAAARIIHLSLQRCIHNLFDFILVVLLLICLDDLVLLTPPVHGVPVTLICRFLVKKPRMSSSFLTIESIIGNAVSFMRTGRAHDDHFHGLTTVAGVLLQHTDSDSVHNRFVVIKKETMSATGGSLSSRATGGSCAIA